MTTLKQVIKEAGYKDDQADYIERKMKEAKATPQNVNQRIKGRLAGVETATLATELQAAEERLDNKPEPQKAASKKVTDGKD